MSRDRTTPPDGDFAAVLAAAVAGEEAAFVALWRELQPPLRRYLGVLAPAWADDVASETWHDVVRGLPRFRGDEHGFRSWVFTIGRHRALDWLRREARQAATPVPVEWFADREAADDTAGSALDAISAEDALAMLRRLPADQAEVLALRVVAGMDVAMVSAVTGKRPGNVRVLAHRGLRRLAEELASAPDHARG